jgi:phospholipase C
MVLASATLDGFWGNNPLYRRSSDPPPQGPGLGCDSNRVEKWWNGTKWIWDVPSCVPDQSGNGPFHKSPVAYVPTIFDLLDEAGKSWKIYGAGGAENPNVKGYLWTVCPTFYECLGSSQVRNFVPASRVLNAAATGKLPAFALVTPTAADSQHNSQSMAVGDNWMGSVVSAIENGPEWESTVIFITWDDCGCFYDHVSPLPFGADWGIRVPMIIVSPYAKPGYTDSNPATYASLLAFTEHTFGIRSLNPCGSTVGCSDDANAYDYADAFDLSQAPLVGTTMVHTHVPEAELRYIEEHPGKIDGT